jgi:hypothetical protein
MRRKYKNTEKIFESLPRQSTVDQLKRIRDEIKKSQEIIVGPETTHMKGDVGDRVIDDLVKHKGKQEMNNLFWWDNPLDRYIDSYETFVQNDSRDSLGYTKDGDPKKHKGTDYVKEAVNTIEDPDIKMNNLKKFNELFEQVNNLTNKQKEEIKNCFKRSDIFTVFVENHLDHYPEERINGEGLTQNIDPLKAMKLHGYLKHIQDNLEKDIFDAPHILLDILNKSKKLDKKNK